MTKTSRLLEALTGADAVVVGAGAGLSTSAGFTYSGERFQKYFADFILSKLWRSNGLTGAGTSGTTATSQPPRTRTPSWLSC